MSKIPVTKLVENGTKKTVNTVTKVAKKSSRAAVDVINKSSKAVSKVVSKNTKDIQKSVSSVQFKLNKFCNPKNIIPCITAITIIAYIVLVTPSSVLDVFGTKFGKIVTMSVVLVTLLFDLKIGILVGLAAILSIALASVNKELYETLSEEYVAENYAKPVDYILENPDKSCSKTTQDSETKIKQETILEITGLDDHLKNYGILNQDS